MKMFPQVPDAQRLVWMGSKDEVSRTILRCSGACLLEIKPGTKDTLYLPEYPGKEKKCSTRLKVRLVNPRTRYYTLI